MPLSTLPAPVPPQSSFAVCRDAISNDFQQRPVLQEKAESVELNAATQEL